MALSTWGLDNMGAIQSYREQIGPPPVSVANKVAG